jgi:hypothetical protein
MTWSNLEEAQFTWDDGGRAAAGYKGTTGDCVVRAVTIATEQDYQLVYNDLSEGCSTQRLTRRAPHRKASARDGVHVKRVWFKRYMANIGWVWTPTMHIGSGCRVHLRADELPPGRLIVSVSRHYTAVVDGIVHDLYNPSREGTRCVYGYWRAA